MRSLVTDVGVTWAEVWVDKSLQVLCVTTGQQTLGS